MNKKVLIPVILLLALLLGGIAYLYLNLDKQKKANQEMQELAELDKKEMENEYQEFARQYSEMKTQINNDSIVAQLTQEQLRTQELLKELQRVKTNDAREITRQKKELATCRAVIRSYVLEIDSLNRLNENLKTENTRVRGQYEEATRQIENLNTEKSSLSQKVAIAAQLDATGIQMIAKKKNGKSTDKMNDSGEFLDCQECYGHQRHTYSLCAHHDTNGQRTFEWRHFPLREPQPGILDEESC